MVQPDEGKKSRIRALFALGLAALVGLVGGIAIAIGPQESKPVEARAPAVTVEPPPIVAEESESLPPRALAASFQEPWPEDFTREEQIESAMVRASEFFRASTGQADLRVFVQPPTSPETKQWVETLAHTLLDPFAEELPETVNIIVGWDPDFMVQVVEENQISAPMVDDQVCRIAFGACSKGSSVWVGSGGPLDGLANESNFARLFVHKTFHVVQDLLDPKSAGQIPPRAASNFRPVWFTEGGADYMAATIAELAHGIRYEESMTQGSGYFYFSEQGVDQPGLRDLEEWGSAKSQPDRYNPIAPPQYLFGQVAMEYLVASVGFGSVAEIYRQLGSGKSFEEAFRLGVGLSLDEFYEKFETNRVLKLASPTR